VENRFMWFEYVEKKCIDSLVRRMDQTEDSYVRIGIRRPRKTIRETIMIDL